MFKKILVKRKKEKGSQENERVAKYFQMLIKRYELEINSYKAMLTGKQPDINRMNAYLPEGKNYEQKKKTRKNLTNLMFQNGALRGEKWEILSARHIRNGLLSRYQGLVRLGFYSKQPLSIARSGTRCGWSTLITHLYSRTTPVSSRN